MDNIQRLNRWLPSSAIENDFVLRKSDMCQICFSIIKTRKNWMMINNHDSYFGERCEGGGKFSYRYRYLENLMENTND